MEKEHFNWDLYRYFNASLVVLIKLIEKIYSAVWNTEEEHWA